MTHTIEVEEKLMKELTSGLRTFLLIKDDRNFIAGDTVIFQNLAARDEHKMEVACLEVEAPGLKSNFVILGLKEKE